MISMSNTVQGRNYFNRMYTLQKDSVCYYFTFSSITSSPTSKGYTGAAAQNLCLQASSMGLMAHQLGGFDAEKARQTFSIPAQFKLMAMISVGHPVNESDIPEDLLARETAEIRF